jgi:hypothetical protein
MNEWQNMIAAFRGLPRMPPDAQPRALRMESLISGIVKDLRIEIQRPEEQIMQHWRLIVGPDRAHRCQPSKILDGKTLVITTTHAVLRTELKFDSGPMLARLKKSCPDCGIEALLIR